MSFFISIKYIVYKENGFDVAKAFVGKMFNR